LFKSRGGLPNISSGEALVCGRSSETVAAVNSAGSRKPSVVNLGYYRVSPKCHRRDQGRVGLADERDGRRVEMILVDVGDEDEVGLFGGAVVARTRRVDMDDLAAALKLEVGLRDRRDGDVAFLRGLHGHRGRLR
nr:hypothetical protein [Acidobacteriota bacterium]